MKLDPEIALMLEAAKSYKDKGVGDLPVHEACQAYRDRYRARGIVVDRVVETEDLTVRGSNGPIQGRLYRAPANNAERPVALYFHGGGFMLGDIEAYDSQSRMLAALSGVDILFVDYRRAPEHRFPAAIDDALGSTEWVVANARSLGFDEARIALAGDSAGGNLAVNVALTARDHGGPQLARQFLLYPVADFRPFAGGPSYPSVETFGKGFFLDTRLMEHFARNYLNSMEEAQDLRVSPLVAEDLSGLPPTVIVTAGHDPLRDSGYAFFEALRKAGTAAEYHCMEGMVHNFMGHAGVSAGARHAFEFVADALADALT